MSDVVQDAKNTHWVYRMPRAWRPFLQLSRLDRPIGYWLLTLPGWIGLAFASLKYGIAQTDFKWAALIFIGAIAMRGAGCTYNDIIDQDLDLKVSRTALRPIPAKTVTTRQAWIWLFVQCCIGLIVLLCLPRLSQIISLCSIPLVAAYPFMKRITWWPQLWLGLTFNWAVLVAYAAKTGTVSLPLFILYGGLMFWTIGYDTIYACQDIEDDALIGVKSTARRFGKHVKSGVGLSYLAMLALIFWATGLEVINLAKSRYQDGNWDYFFHAFAATHLLWPTLLFLGIMGVKLFWITRILKPTGENALMLFKANQWSAYLLIAALVTLRVLSTTPPFTPS